MDDTFIRPPLRRRRPSVLGTAIAMAAIYGIPTEQDVSEFIDAVSNIKSDGCGPSFRGRSIGAGAKAGQVFKDSKGEKYTKDAKGTIRKHRQV